MLRTNSLRKARVTAQFTMGGRCRLTASRSFCAGLARRASQPSADQHQCTTMGYTNAAIIYENDAYGEGFKESLVDACLQLGVNVVSFPFTMSALFARAI